MSIPSGCEGPKKLVIGTVTVQIASALTEGRQKISNDTRDLTQEILDSYGSGVAIVDLVLQKVAPPDQATYLRVYNQYAPLWHLLDEGASEKVRKGNYERLFDEARRKVRAWEQTHAE